MMYYSSEGRFGAKELEALELVPFYHTNGVIDKVRPTKDGAVLFFHNPGQPPRYDSNFIIGGENLGRLTSQMGVANLSDLVGREIKSYVPKEKRLKIVAISPAEFNENIGEDAA